MKKRLNDDQELIRAILGNDKFLMLNLKLVQSIGLNEAVYLTYILDKLEYTLNWDSDILNKGIVVFRKDIQNKFNLSDHQQRKVEKNLIQKELISIKIQFDGMTTFNTYKVDITKLYEVLNFVEEPSNLGLTEIQADRN